MAHPEASRPRAHGSSTMRLAFVAILVALVYQSFIMQRLSRRLGALEEALAQSNQAMAAIKARQDSGGGRKKQALQAPPFPGMGGPGLQEYYPASPRVPQPGDTDGSVASATPSGADTAVSPESMSSPRPAGALAAASPLASSASTPAPAAVRKASDLVRLLATLIVLEYKPEINLNKQQNAAARAAVADHVRGRLGASALRSRVEGLLTKPQRAWLDQERAQIDTKVAELLEMPDKDDKAYAELVLEFLKMPIQPNI